MCDEVTFHVAGQLSADDYVRGQRLHAGKLAGCVFPAVVLIFAVLMTSLGAWIRSWEAWPLFLIGLGIPAVYLYVRGTLLKRLFRQQPSLSVADEGTLSAAGMFMRSELGESRLPWRFFVRVKANDRVLLLYTAPNAFHIIPRSFFRTDEEFRLAAAAVKEWVRRAARSPVA